MGHGPGEEVQRPAGQLGALQHACYSADCADWAGRGQEGGQPSTASHAATKHCNEQCSSSAQPIISNVGRVGGLWGTCGERVTALGGPVPTPPPTPLYAALQPAANVLTGLMLRGECVGARDGGSAWGWVPCVPWRSAGWAWGGRGGVSDPPR